MIRDVKSSKMKQKNLAVIFICNSRTQKLENFDHSQGPNQWPGWPDAALTLILIFWVGKVYISAAESSHQLCWNLVASQKQNSKSWRTIYQSSTEGGWFLPALHNLWQFEPRLLMSAATFAVQFTLKWSQMYANSGAVVINVGSTSSAVHWLDDVEQTFRLLKLDVEIVMTRAVRL
jgi:hypothetical protein